LADANPNLILISINFETSLSWQHKSMPVNF
jgi:hypothetical protein